MSMGHQGIWGKGNGTYPPNMYDSAVKVPLIICDPRNKKKGAVCSSMSSQYDMFPTILELAGCKWDPEPIQPGRSMTEMLRVPEKETDDSIVIYDEYGRTRMIRSRKYKYIHRYGDGICELYDMIADPDETVNLAEDQKYASVVSSMRKDMEEWSGRYTEEKADPRKFDVKGTGQQRLCWEKDAFNSRIEFYDTEKKVVL